MPKQRTFFPMVAAMAAVILVLASCTSTTETTIEPPETTVATTTTTTAAPTTTETAPPPPAVLAAVGDIIATNCADCHTALPSDHSGAQDSDQCGLCHIPYGHATAPEHLATTEGCANCHQTPESTHFFLRDEEDQTVLAADATDRCIACHRDGSVNPDGRGTPALTTDADILAAATNGTLRAWIQPGGFMAKYLTDGEAATITSWIDEISGDRILDYVPYLDATKIDSDIAESDLLASPAWDDAPQHTVAVVPTIFTATDQIEMKALYSNDYLYVWVEYADSTASLTRGGSWILDEGQWRHPAAASDNDKQSEDRVSLIWNISTPDFEAGYGCALKCHGNVPGSSEFTDLEGSTMDIWHSKAARGLGVISAADNGNLTIDTASEGFEVTGGELEFTGVVDDKRLVWYMDLDDGYDLEDSGRRGDAGGSAYGHNRNGDKSAPVYIETTPASWADAMVLTQAEVDAGETIVADPTDSAYDSATVAAAWDVYSGLGAVVPERLLRLPEGSRGDVLHAATWKDGTWTNVFRRSLITDHPDDVQFDLTQETEYDFSIAIFDNCGRGEIPPGHTTYGDGQYQILRFK